VTINPVNDVPSFTKGGDQGIAPLVLEDAGAQSVTNWATNISVGPPNEHTAGPCPPFPSTVCQQTATFNVANSNNALFSAQPAIAANGALTYTPAPNANGSAIVTVSVSDNGGTAFGGIDTSASQTFTITVTPVNDAPSFTSGGDPTIPEDAGSQSVAWATAVSAGPPNENAQTLTFEVSNGNNALFTTQPAIAPDGTLTYLTEPDANGTALVTVTLKDDGGVLNGGVDRTPPQTFTITVTPVNDTPVAGDDLDRKTKKNTPLAIPASELTANDSAGPANESGQVLEITVLVSSAVNGSVALDPQTAESACFRVTLPAARSDGEQSNGTAVAG